MYISNAFEAKRAALLVEDPAAEDPDEYLAENVFWVPKEARWSPLQDNAKQPPSGSWRHRTGHPKGSLSIR
jgi:type I restriction enzyme M protein